MDSSSYNVCYCHSFLCAFFWDPFRMPKRTAHVCGLQDSVTPHKKAPTEWFKGCTCACQRPQVCVPLVKKFDELRDAQGGFWSVPAAFIALDERDAKHRTQKNESAIQQRVALRAAWLKHIKPKSGCWGKGDYISRVHFHHSVVDLSLPRMTKGGLRHLMPSVVPKHIAESIGNYTNADKIQGCKNGNYFPVPNCPLGIATARLATLHAAKDPTPAGVGTCSLSNSNGDLLLQVQASNGDLLQSSIPTHDI